MALCSNEIYIGYTIGLKGTVVVPPFLISSSGTYNGKSYYTWFESLWGYDIVLRWNLLGYWELIYTDGLFQALIANLNYIPSDCPANPSLALSWVSFNFNWTNINTTLGNALETVSTEEEDCFKILVWNKQCEFGECVKQYLLQLQFGILDCKILEKLKNKKRILEILNCYDVRDIPTNTTNYNILTYQEIKNLLNY